MNELSEIVPPKIGGGNPAAKADAPLAGAAKPVAPGQPAAVAAGAAGGGVAAFGGHRGGGKQRKDGLPAGSDAAKKADLEKARVRMQAVRAAKKVAALPPPLPAVAPAGQGANSALAADPRIVPAAAVGAAVPATPLFVAWSEKILKRPVALLTRIFDRLRVSSLMQRVRKLGLTKAEEQEIESAFQYEAVLVEDFNAALSNTLMVELNRMQAPGAQHSHYIELVMTGGELALNHMACVDKLEKLLAENAKLKKDDATALN